MTELPKIPNPLANIARTAKTGGKTGHYQPSVFFRKPSGLMRYRHGGYNAVFPLVNTGDLSIMDMLFDGDVPKDASHGARREKSPTATPMGQVITFPKK
ncbi:MAG: hypothetical protein QM529_05790 [Hydrotalea sp.]|nr:hypothetical protein [Hydrotalea sp.]